MKIADARRIWLRATVVCVRLWPFAKVDDLGIWDIRTEYMDIHVIRHTEILIPTPSTQTVPVLTFHPENRVRRYSSGGLWTNCLIFSGLPFASKRGLA